MIPAAMARLAEREPELPGLRVLFDLLGGTGPADPGPLVPRYLRLKPGTSLTVGLDTPTGPAFASMTSAEAAPKLDKLLGSAPPGSVLLHDTRARLVIARPSADRALPGMRRSPVGPWATLAYKPQRRWVGRALGPDGTAEGPVLRRYRSGHAATARARWPELAEPPVRVPAVLGHHARTATLTTAPLPGARLDTLEPGPALAAGLRTAGHALARWHALPIPAHRATAVASPDTVAATLRHLLPEEDRRITNLARRLERAATGGNGTPPGWVHGDFSADQVLVDLRDGAVAFLDWDHAGAGARADDLANADAAGLDPAEPGLAPSLWSALLEGYAEVTPLPHDLGTTRARAAFARAADPFRAALPSWPSLVAARLDRAEELLG